MEWDYIKSKCSVPEWYHRAHRFLGKKIFGMGLLRFLLRYWLHERLALAFEVRRFSTLLFHER